MERAIEKPKHAQTVPDDNSEEELNPSLIEQHKALDGNDLAHYSFLREKMNDPANIQEQAFGAKDTTDSSV